MKLVLNGLAGPPAECTAANTRLMQRGLAAACHAGGERAAL